MIMSVMNKKDCCGCSACADICPKSSISMERDQDGFIYPILDYRTCVDCGLCDSVCPILQANRLKSTAQQNFYAAINRDRKTLSNSSSGGVFSVISNYVLSQGGVVCGAAYDADHSVSHIIIEKVDDLFKLRGSKYVFSENRGIYKQLKGILNAGRIVYYSGTGCQVAGLKAYLRKEYDNLITSDIVCHGTPSPKAFLSFINYFEDKHSGKVVGYNFRDKTYNGWSCTTSIEYISNGRKKYLPCNPISDAYFSAFISGIMNRESCYNCAFTTKERVGDITLADYWGVENYHPDLNRYLHEGVSFICVNTEKGKNLLDKLKLEMRLIPTCFEWATVINKNLVEQTHRPNRRDTIYEELSVDPSKVIKEFIPKHYTLRLIKLYIKRILKTNPFLYSSLSFIWRKLL